MTELEKLNQEWSLARSYAHDCGIQNNGRLVAETSRLIAIVSDEGRDARSRVSAAIGVAKIADALADALTSLDEVTGESDVSGKRGAAHLRAIVDATAALTTTISQASRSTLRAVGE